MSRAAAGLLFALALVCAPAGSVWAQAYTFAHFGGAEGILNPSVHAVGEDTDGSLWVGTEAGVFRADGSHWERVTRYSPTATGIVMGLGADPAGRFWVLSEEELAYDLNGTVHLPVGPEAVNSGSSTMQLYVPRGGRAEFDRTHYAVFILRGTSLEQVRTDDGGKSWHRRPVFSAAMLAEHPQWARLVAIAGEEHSDPDAPMRLWAGCGEELCRITMPADSAGSPEVESWGAAQGVPAANWQALVFAGAQGKSAAGCDRVWARSRGQLLSLDLCTGKAEEVGRGRPLAEETHEVGFALLRDGQGRIVTNFGEGLARWDGSRWELIGEASGLGEARVTTLYQDRNRSLWMGSLGHGLTEWEGYGQWQGWTRRQGLSGNTLWDLARDRSGTLWAATQDGLDRLVPEERRWTRPAQVASIREPFSMTADARGHLWVGTGSGRLWDYNTATHALRLVGDHLGSVDAVQHDGEGRIWVGSEAAGLLALGPGDGWQALHPEREPQAPTGVIFAVAVGKEGGKLWVSASSGLFQRDAGGWRTIKLDGSVRLNSILALAPDGSLWLSGRSAEAALVRVRVEEDGTGGLRTKVLLSLSATALGTPAPALVAYDRRGWLWVGGESGLHVWNGVRWVDLTTEDGLVWDDVDGASFLSEADGSVWIGTSGGLSHLLHPESVFHPDPPRLVVHAAMLDSHALRTGYVVSVSHRNPMLTVKLGTTDADRPGAVSYRYEMEGLEASWQEIDGSRLQLPMLQPGTYHLRLIAVDTRRSLQSAPVEFVFTVLQPWWNRWWFRGLEAGVVLLVLWVLWRGSVRVMVARQAELERLVAARTEELEREKAELLEARARLLELSRHDALTGILNRAAIFERLTHERTRAHSAGEELAVVMADLDHFKQINDSYGHQVGDAVIRECARRLQATLRTGDSVGRYGGEELLVLIPGLRPESAFTRMEELRQSIAREPVVHEGVEVWVTCSFGLAWMVGEEVGMEEAIARADEALYRAKQNGRNRVEFAGALV